MNRPSLIVLDVGHGNAAVLLDKGVIVIDAGKGGMVLDFLKSAGISVVDVLLISHADSDHIRNAPDLLLDDEIDVRLVCFNSDAGKSTRVWRHFRHAIKIARRKKSLVAEPQLTLAQTGRLDRGKIRIEVLYPPPELAAAGPGGEDEYAQQITPNSMSAAIRLVRDGIPLVLLAGDVEHGCLDFWRDERTDPRAKILVFPHHGGDPGTADPVAFAEQLCTLVQPQAAIFSIHRSQYELPIPALVQAVRKTSPELRIVCTELAKHCAATEPDEPSTVHLEPLPAAGRERGFCCAGTMVIELHSAGPVLRPLAEDHQGFIRRHAPSALCQEEIG
jgi:beta-lactamase superfamily II metal-dependent hydrolase